jgi:site-specific DNA-methyltransferase (adenine-specific)
MQQMLFETPVHAATPALRGQLDRLVSKTTLLCGDCLQLMETIADSSVDLVLTDPPFSSGTRREASKGLRKSMNRGVDRKQWFGSDSLTVDGFLFLLRACALEWHRILKDGGHILCFIDWRMMAHLADAIESADLRRCGVIVWDKTYFGMGSCFRNQHEMILHFTKDMGCPPQRKDVGNVIQAKPVRNGVHPTEKPTDLLGKLISVVCPEGGVVLDPFMGGGSTGLACKETGRSFIGLEREKGYYQIATKRIEAVQRADKPVAGPFRQSALLGVSGRMR